eukprot:scaffold37469_cov76-Attheya_sp.AAC.2
MLFGNFKGPRLPVENVNILFLPLLLWGVNEHFLFMSDYSLHFYCWGHGSAGGSSCADFLLQISSSFASLTDQVLDIVSFQTTWVAMLIQDNDAPMACEFEALFIAWCADIVCG